MTSDSVTREMGIPKGTNAIARARAYGIDIEQLRAILKLTPAERLDKLQLRISKGEDAVARAEAYGIDISLLKEALTWTPAQRLQKLEDLVNAVHALHQSGMKKHGIQAYPRASDTQASETD